MNFYDVLKHAAENSGTPLSQIGLSLGKAPNHVNNAVSRGSDPSCNNAADMLGVCGWSLVAMPTDDVPKDALIINGNE